MKILCLSDLHINNSKDRKKKLRWIASIIDDSVDIVVISGDIFEYTYQYNINPYQKLSEITDKPVICTLGNHEFVDNTIKDTLKFYQDKYEPNKYNVHYLDVCGHYDINDFRFVGNWLCYDGSMRCFESQNLYDWGNGNWLDRRIVDFDYEKEHDRCKKQILDNVCDDKQNILVTHCVPNVNLNGHPRTSVLNAFGGVENFLKEYDFKYSISGHTHWKVVGLELEGCKCVNVGNDYYEPFHHFLLEV